MYLCACVPVRCGRLGGTDQGEFILILVCTAPYLCEAVEAPEEPEERVERADYDVRAAQYVGPSLGVASSQTAIHREHFLFVHSFINSVPRAEESGVSVVVEMR